MILTKEGGYMFIKSEYAKDQESSYQQILLSLEPLLQGAPNTLAKLCNTAALLNVYLDNINWVGFYLAEDNVLTLGPFQGLPACDTIPFSRGVCGKAATTQTVQRIEDVHQFPGHIACDGNSKSEIVLPIIVDGRLYAVLDIDSPIKARFDETDEYYLKQIVLLIEKSI